MSKNLRDLIKQCNVDEDEIWTSNDITQPELRNIKLIILYDTVDLHKLIKYQNIRYIIGVSSNEDLEILIRLYRFRKITVYKDFTLWTRLR